MLTTNPEANLKSLIIQSDAIRHRPQTPWRSSPGEWWVRDGTPFGGAMQGCSPRQMSLGRGTKFFESFPSPRERGNFQIKALPKKGRPPFRASFLKPMPGNKFGGSGDLYSERFRQNEKILVARHNGCGACRQCAGDELVILQIARALFSQCHRLN